MARVSNMLLLSLTLQVAGSASYAASAAGAGAQIPAGAATQSEPDQRQLLTIRRWIDTQADSSQIARGLQLALEIVQRDARQIEAVLEVLSSSSHLRNVSAQDHPDVLRAIDAAARSQIPTLPAESSARAGYQLVGFEDTVGIQTWEAGIRLFMEQHAGTEIALESQVDLLMRQRNASRNALSETLGMLDDFVSRHPGTTAAAKALHQKGFMLGSNAIGSDIEPRGADPTERLMTMIAIVNELESGRYPRCRWVDEAPQLVAGFYTFNQSYAPKNVAKVVAAFRDFALQHFPSSATPAVSSVADPVILRKLDDVAPPGGKRTDLAERLLVELEQDPARATRARFLHAQLYLGKAIEDGANRDQHRARARVLFEQVLTSGEGEFSREAHETLASLDFSDSQDDRARDLMLEYLARYPDAPFAPTAALRIGVLEEIHGDAEAAIGAYRLAARTYAKVPMARILGRAFAAHLLEAAGRFADARQEYQLALSGWSADDPQGYGLDMNRQLDPLGALARSRGRVDRATIIARVKELDTLVALPGAALLDRGRALVEAGRMREALEPLEAFLKTNPPAEPLAEARLLAHRVRLDDALALVDLANQQPEPAAALQALEQLAAEPYDVAVFAAKIARASVSFTLGSSVAAERSLKAALEEWRVHSNSAAGRALNPLEEDVRKIRDLIFKPAGGGWLDAAGWGRASPFPRRPYVVVNPAVTVKTAGGEKAEIVLAQTFSEAATVLFLTGREGLLLSSILDALAGRFSIIPSPLEIPPARTPAADVREFLNRFLYAERAGQWGSWNFFAVPVPYEVEFMDEARTKASIKLGMDNSGVTIVLEKVGAEWRFVRVATMSVV